MHTVGDLKDHPMNSCYEQQNMWIRSGRFVTREGLTKYNTTVYKGEINLVHLLRNPVTGNKVIVAYADKLDLDLSTTALRAISTAQELQDVNNNLTASYYLTNNIDMSGFGAFTPIGPTAGATFKGSIDGRGYTIDKLTVTRGATQYNGLVGYTDTASFRNLFFTDLQVTGADNTAGIVGFLSYGEILNCHIQSMTATGVSGNNTVGAIFAQSANDCLVWKCSAKGYVESSAGGGDIGGAYGIHAAGIVSECYFDGTANGVTPDVFSAGLRVGGFGGNQGAGGTTRNCWVAAKVQGASEDAFIQSDAGTSSGNYADSDIDTTGSFTGATARTSVQMTQEALFANWDFENIWTTSSDTTYPRFQRTYTGPKMSAANLKRHSVLVDGIRGNQTTDGLTAEENLSIVAPVAACGTAQKAGGSLTALGVYKFAYEYYNKDRGQPSAMSPESSVVTLAGGNNQVTITIPTNTALDKQVTHARVYTTDTSGAIFYQEASEIVAYTGTAVTIDISSADSARQIPMGELDGDNDFLNNLDVHKRAIPYKHCLEHKNRMWLWGGERFTDGTAAVTKASDTVTFLDAVINEGIEGMFFQVDGDPTRYVIESRDFPWQITLTENYAWTTDATAGYTIYGEESTLRHSYVGTDGTPYPGSYPDSYKDDLAKDSGFKAQGLAVAGQNLIAFNGAQHYRISGTDHASFAPYFVASTGSCSGYTVVSDGDGNVIWCAGKDGCFISNGFGEPSSLTETSIGNIFNGDDNPPFSFTEADFGELHAVWDDRNKRYHLYDNAGRGVIYDFKKNPATGRETGWTTYYGIKARCSGVIEVSGIERVAIGDNGGDEITGIRKGYVNYYDPTATNDGAATYGRQGSITNPNALSFRYASGTVDEVMEGTHCVVISDPTAPAAVGQVRRIDSVGVVSRTMNIDVKWTTDPSVDAIIGTGNIINYRESNWTDLGTRVFKDIDVIEVNYDTKTYDATLEYRKDYDDDSWGTFNIDMQRDGQVDEVEFGLVSMEHLKWKISHDVVDEPIGINELNIRYEVNDDADRDL